MPFCSECGQKIKEETKFCSNCDKKYKEEINENKELSKKNTKEKVKKSRKWVIFIAIILVIIVIVIILGVVLDQLSRGGIAREVLCQDTKNNCYNDCDEKLIGYFCKKACDKEFNQCMGYE